MAIISSFCSSPRSTCTSLFNFRCGSIAQPRARSLSNHGSSLSGCNKLDGVAMWFINGVVSAFFASLEKCSCISIPTLDFDDANDDQPLIYNDENSRGESRKRIIGNGITTRSGGFDEGFMFMNDKKLDNFMLLNLKKKKYLMIINMFNDLIMIRESSVKQG